jgi:hypothetical protein
LDFFQLIHFLYSIRRLEDGREEIGFFFERDVVLATVEVGMG